jgi:glycosyltransferase involved in cell wall biosynthesis
VLSEVQEAYMRIAHVVDSMEIGGAETLVLQMCHLQREQGNDPCVYAVASLGPLGEQMRAGGFSVLANVGWHLADPSRNFFRVFKETHPDVVHLHNPTPTVYAAMAARMAGVPCIVSTRHNLAASPRRLIVEFKYAIATTFCDWIVGICDATTNNLKKARCIPARKIVRVYNGTDPVSRVTHQQWPPKTGFTLVYVGRLEPVKNHVLLLNAVQAALESMPGLRLWMVGDGSERRTLENLASELGIASQVMFFGLQLDVAPFFSAADAFIMSSKSEGLPISLLQAFSLGLPAIVTDVGGMAEVVRLARAGFTVPATNPAEMVAAILRLASNDEERGQFATHAEEAFLSCFTLKTMVAAYMDLYLNTPRTRRELTA